MIMSVNISFVSVLSHANSWCTSLISVSNFQLVVPRDGCWQKINFERDDPVLDSTADSHAVLGSPCIRDFTSSGKRRYESSADFQEHGVLCQERTHLKEENISYGSSRRLGLHSVFHLSQQDLVGSTMGNTFFQVLISNFI